MKSIYYYYSGNPSDLCAIKKWRVDQGNDYVHNLCPAWSEWGKNTWTVYQPFDFEFEYISKEKKIVSNLDDYLWCAPKWLSGKYPVPQFNLSYFFWTDDKDVWIEQNHHPHLGRLGLELVPGTYPISVWERGSSMGVKVIDQDRHISIPRGTPLFYVRFYSQKSDSLFSVEQKFSPLYLSPDRPNKKLKTYVKNYEKFDSWDIIKERLKKEEHSCPFNFLKRK